MRSCIQCNFQCKKRGDWNRHIQSSKHLRFLEPLNELKAENEQLKALVLDQQIELKKQYKQSVSPPRKSFRLEDFLTVRCREAENWPEFVRTFGVGCDTSDITTRIADVMITASNRSGVEKRAIHCLDLKRKKICLKLNGEWVQNEDLVETAIQDTVLKMQSKYIQQTREWQLQHPNWAERESELNYIVELAQRVSSDVDFTRFYSMVLKSILIPKD
jgi:hypothetical protein